MKTFVCVVSALVVVALIVAARTVSAAGCCGSEDSKAAAPKAEVQTIAQKTCPVMGNPINPKIFVDYKDRRIYFCCKMCPPVFNKDPEKYVKIVDEQLKAAKGAKMEGSATYTHEGHAH